MVTSLLAPSALHPPACLPQSSALELPQDLCKHLDHSKHWTMTSAQTLTPLTVVSLTLCFFPLLSQSGGVNRKLKTWVASVDRSVLRIRERVPESVVRSWYWVWRQYVVKRSVNLPSDLLTELAIDQQGGLQAPGGRKETPGISRRYSWGHSRLPKLPLVRPHAFPQLLPFPLTRSLYSPAYLIASSMRPCHLAYTLLCLEHSLGL